MKTRWVARAAVVSFVLGLGVLSPQVAEAADPNATAVDEMYWAFTACKKGLEGRFDDDKQRGNAEYKERKAKAVKADASITSFTGKVKSMFVMQEWLKKCDVDLPAQAAAAAVHEQAERDANQASIACSAAKREATDEAFTKYTGLRDRAKKLPAIVNESHGNGRTVGQMFTDCDKEIPAAIEARKKAEADAKKFQEEQQKKYEAEKKKQEEEDAKIAAKMKKLLKGDRWRIWDREGDPSDYPGERFQVASYWDYTTTSSLTNLSCTIRYRFSGNKLVRKTKAGFCD